MAMSIREPFPMGSAFHEPPNCVWELMVEMEFDPSLPPEEIERRKSEMWDRIVAALELATAVGAASIEIEDIGGRGKETPIFPLVVGSARYTSTLDVVDIVETLCKEQTELGSALAYDASGRAYEIDIGVQYRRRPSSDGLRRPDMPNPMETKWMGMPRNAAELLGRAPSTQPN